VVDNTDELLKFLPYKNRVGLLLRISFRSRAAVVDLSRKFGCAVSDAPEMLTLAAHLGIHIKGLCFHVGSQCLDAKQQADAIHTCNTLIRQHRDTGAAPISMVDIGGGFQIAYDDKPLDIDRYRAPIRRALAELPPYVHVVAEPGRFSHPIQFAGKRTRDRAECDSWRRGRRRRGPTGSRKLGSRGLSVPACPLTSPNRDACPVSN